jgi:hypothetical protein
MKKFLKKLKHGIIYLIAAPAAVIHTAYQVWYFREFYLKSGAAKPSENVGKQRD